MAAEAGRALPVLKFESLDSTNDEALRRLAAGERGPALICAGTQTAGRGRDGRLWVSPPGNLYATIIARLPQGRAPGEAAFVAAVTAGDAILGCCPALADLRYKWPNDLLANGRKLAGVLVEGDGRGGLAIGIGINVESAPDGVVWPATCLRMDGAPAATAELLATALGTVFTGWYDTWARDGFAPLRRAWLDRAYGIGCTLRARLPGGAVYDGTFKALAEDGALLLDQGAAGTRRIAAGEIVAGAG